MDPVSLTVIFKGVGLILVLVFGFLIARYGYHLYKDGAGLGRDKSAFEVGSVKIKAHSVGSVVMGTAFLWAYAGVLLSPNLDKDGDNYRIYSFRTDGLEASIPAFSMFLGSEPVADFLDNPKVLESIFATGMLQTNFLEHVSVEGERAELLPASTRAEQVDGRYRLSTTLEARNTRAEVFFASEYRDGMLTFTPEKVERPDE